MFRSINGSGLLARGRAGFALAAYDRRRELVIDPTVDFTTFFGGNGADEPAAIAVDRDGLTYVTGGTSSRNFPATNGTRWEDCMVFDFGGFCSTGFNTFVAKLNP